MSLVVLDREALGYGARRVLSEVSLRIAAGERVALLGRSGAGKTTLLNAIYDRLIASGRRVALAPQDHALTPQLSVARNVLMGRLDDHGALYNLANLVLLRRRDRAEILDMLAELGLVDEADRAVETLSGGQKQRTALGRAFYRGGAALIADEPVSAVDEAQAAALLDRARARFETTIVALHDLTLARAFATRLVGLRNGAILLDAPPDRVSPSQLDDLYAA